MFGATNVKCTCLCQSTISNLMRDKRLEWGGGGGGAYNPIGLSDFQSNDEWITEKDDHWLLENKFMDGCTKRFTFDEGALTSKTKGGTFYYIFILQIHFILILIIILILFYIVPNNLNVNHHKKEEEPFSLVDGDSLSDILEDS